MILVYQAYGRDDVIEQTQFSVISLLNHIQDSSPLKIWIYTDKPQVFEYFFAEHLKPPRNRLSVVARPVAQFVKWRGSIDFVHRVKVEVLIDAAKNFKGSLVYLDGDTFFRQDPTNLFSKINDQVSLLHVVENQIDLGRDPLSKKITRFIRKNIFNILSQEVKLSPQLIMWNAGAIGLSEKNKNLLPLVLELTDKMYTIYPKHVMEQMAFSYYLQDRTQVIACDDLIGHYWNQKDEFQNAIHAFLDTHKNIGAALAHYSQFEWPVLKSIEKTIKRSIFSKFSSWISGSPGL